MENFGFASLGEIQGEGFFRSGRRVCQQWFGPIEHHLHRRKSVLNPTWRGTPTTKPLAANGESKFRSLFRPGPDRRTKYLWM